MGAPAPFPESNFIWWGWPADEKRDEVLDLPTHRSSSETISCWALTDDEIREIVRTRKVWLRVVGEAHPPVLVQGDSPFEDPDCRELSAG